MIDLVLAVGCSLGVGMIFKVAGRRGLDRLALLTANYAAALLIAGVILAYDTTRAAGGLTPEGGLVALGVSLGALFIIGFFVLALATEVAGMTLAIGVMRVSVVIPFLASWIIWNEVPTPAQGVGLLVAGIAFFMIARKDASAAAVSEPSRAAPSAAPPRVFGVLVLLFFLGGTVDVFMKAFDEHYAAGNSRALFLLLVFGIAFLIGFILVCWQRMRRGTWPTGAALGWGLVLGVANYGSVAFLLRAIRQLSGPFVFPANNIAIVVGAALLGVYIWDEHLSRLNQAGLGLAVLALVLLNL